MNLFQVFSRNNDVNGNPYRLILVYSPEGAIVEAYESRSSSPNIRGQLCRKGYIELAGFHLAPSEYNQTKRSVRDGYKLEVVRAD